MCEYSPRISYHEWCRFSYGKHIWCCNAFILWHGLMVDWDLHKVCQLMGMTLWIWKFGVKTEITKWIGAGWINLNTCGGVGLLGYRRMLTKLVGRSTKQWSDQQYNMRQKHGLQRRDKKNGLSWTIRECYDGCAEWHANYNTRNEHIRGRVNESSVGF